jgi:hypothetical protein
VRRDDMEQKAAQEFLGPQFHELRPTPSGVVFLAKAHEAIADEDQAGIGDSHPVSGAAQILQHWLRAPPGRFGVDNPPEAVQLAKEGYPVGLLH